MLQCTAVTKAPPGDVPDAPAAVAGGPDSPPDAVTPNHLPFLLCELGEHDDAFPEHAAYLRSAGPSSAPALWFFWTGAGLQRVNRVDTVPWCPAVLRHLGTGVVQRCAFFDRHPPPHSWSVTDPLGDLIAERLLSGDGPDTS
ncbi:hypothetical protein ACH4KN_32705 [Streptomyces sp. NPDC017546]|uniref:hypothetical protein n=1 Tax=Streptomyces sp. NPDC017546 TaxID=3365001 RepID=UPI0037A82375